MKKRMIAFMMAVAMLLGCVCDVSVVSAAEENSEKYYLRSDYAVSIEGVSSGVDKTDGSTGDPQIDVDSGTTAKIVVQADRLSEMSAATVTYAQNVGELDVKLTALTSADAAEGVELCHEKLSGASNYATRTSDPIPFTKAVPEDAKFLQVELSVSGSLDGKSYVNYIEVFKNMAVKQVVQWKSLANDKVLDITDSGTGNGNIVTASAASDAKSQTWSIQQDSEKGWYYLVNENSGKGMGLLGGTKDPGEEPVQWTMDGSSNQFWRFVAVEKNGETYYKILNKNSKLALTVNDSKVTQETYTGADNQLFEAVMKQGTLDFASKYDDNYSITNISVSAENYVISYSTAYSMQDGMYFEMLLSDGQNNAAGKGTFTVDKDGEYTLTASVYEDSTKNVKVCEDYTQTFTLTNGEYKVVGAEWTVTTEQSPWTENGVVEVRDVTDDQVEEIKESAANYIYVDQNTRYQTMDSNPWGGCFNEKGWYAMRDLTDEQKESVIQALFDPNTDGLKLSAGRTPIGASDFGLDMYTYADAEWDDYDMSSFSIDQDKEYLIPYIKAAMKYVPDMPLFSSPWTPPAWMKTNNKLNGVESGFPGIEDTEENFEAYALYFVKYLEAYAEEGIDLYAVTPQNEPTMNTPYPSCVWTGDQLNVFLRDYLCDAIEEYNEKNDKDVEVWLGTFTDSNQSMVWPTFRDPVTSSKVDGYCFQWWGAPLATKLYSQSKAETGTAVKIIQSESKCGGGDNSWQYAEEQFDCYKEFLDAGVSQYYLWNMILEGNGENNAEPASRRWPQNSPISVNGTDIRYNPSYYQVKHFTSNIDSGARRIKVEGNNLGEGSVSGYVQDVRAIGFQNTDGEIVLNVKNSTSAAKDVTVVVNNEAFDVTVPAHSINTFKLDGTYEDTPDATEVVEVEETTNLKFTSAATGDLLSAEGFANGDVINTASNRGESNQTWKLVKAANEGYYHLVNFATELGVAVWNGVTTEGAEIKQYENTGAPDQQWALEFVEYRGSGANRKAYYKIINYKSQLALTALGESDGKALTQKKYAGTDDQLWTLDIVGGEWTFPEDSYTVENAKAELQKDIDAAKKDSENYTEESWQAYQDALQAARDVIADPDATIASVEEAQTNLAKAEAELEEKEEPDPVVIESITVTPPTKIEYTAGEELDLDGMKVIAKYSDGEEKDITEDCEVSGYDKTKTGEQTVTVTYEGKTATFKVTVKEAEEPDTTDKTALEAAVKAAIADTEKGKYTEESWAAYEEALNQAKEVLADTDATQKEIDDAAAALDKATKALESKGLPYEDVAETDWFYDEVAYNYYEGTMTGTDPTHFSPYATLVRAQFATILHRIEGEPDATYTNRFPDVPAEQFYSTAVLWAADAKVVTGYTDSGYFGTNDPITREQMVVMMYRYADYKKYDISKTADINSFSDAGQVSEFAETAMKWAVENGIIEGKENTDGSYRLDPQGSTSRAECAIIIQRFMEKYGEE